jgi:hypothetical protein
MESGINIHEVLTNIGYSLKDCGKEYRARPIYRDSDNDSVLRIYKDSGNWVDFKENISGDFATLIKHSLKLETQDQAKIWLKEKNFVGSTVLKDEKPKIKSAKTFDKDEVDAAIKAGNGKAKFSMGGALGKIVLTKIA